jgi:hypothetical protein
MVDLDCNDGTSALGATAYYGADRKRRGQKPIKLSTKG